ncbi:MAG: hypothetical protein KH149_03895 [Clostridiales bacterium]|nr:hypothetical protein [Clostridiales bacterium]
MKKDRCERYTVRSGAAEAVGMDISFRTTKISQPTSVNCDIGCGNLPLVEARGVEPHNKCLYISNKSFYVQYRVQILSTNVDKYLNNFIPLTS